MTPNTDNPDKPKTNLNIRIDADLKHRLDSYARANSTQVTTIVTRLIEDFLDFKALAPRIVNMSYDDRKKIERFVKQIDLETL